jgi:predicted acylesterase/phospholipase RssA
MPGRGLNLLSLDGGGIRGLSSLQILKQLLEGVAREQDLDDPPKPCEFFDMIGGTSTGGLIAIMLGRLDMTIDECIDAYIELSDRVFRKKHMLPVKISGSIQGKFDSAALEDSVKKLLRNHSLGEDALLKNIGPGKCKVFVCVTSGTTSETVPLTSYRTERTDSDRLKYTQVWQAARATSAASTFFDPITVQMASYAESYTDGATGANNPIYHLWNEAQDAFLQPGERLEDNLDCIVSIGTGVPAISPFGDSLKSLAETLVKISTETEKTAEQFQRAHMDLDDSVRYCRLNVLNGLQDIGLEEADRKDDILNITKHYLQKQDVLKLLRGCTKRLAQHQCVSNFA